MHKKHDRVHYDPVGEGLFRAECSCGDWRHDRDIDLRNERDRVEAEAAWTEHQLQSLRG
jgi:hypothetical protein